MHQTINVPGGGGPVDCHIQNCSIEATGQSGAAPSVAITFGGGPSGLANMKLVPYSGLTETQPVAVIASPLAPSTSYNVDECTTTGCDPTPTPATTGSDGNLSVRIPIRQNITYNDPVTHAPVAVDCSVTQCYVQLLDATMKAVAAPQPFYMAGSQLEPASMIGTVTLPGGKAFPTIAFIAACPGAPCTNPPSQSSIIWNTELGSNYQLNGLTANEPWYAAAAISSNGQFYLSQPVVVTPTPGQQILENFVINGYSPLPSGDIVSGKVTDQSGGVLPPDFYGGSTLGSGSGVLACPGSAVYGDPTCNSNGGLMGNGVITAPYDARGTTASGSPPGNGTSRRTPASTPFPGRHPSTARTTRSRSCPTSTRR